MAPREEAVTIGHISVTGAENGWRLKPRCSQVKAKAADTEQLSVVPGTKFGATLSAPCLTASMTTHSKTGVECYFHFLPFLIIG